MALNTLLPIGFNKLLKKSTQITHSAAALFPFKTAELFQKNKEALYYGVNQLSKHMIFVSRKLLTNPNGVVLGIPGAGKSFLVIAPPTKPSPILLVFLLHSVVASFDVAMATPAFQLLALKQKCGAILARFSRQNNKREIANIREYERAPKAYSGAVS